MRLNQTLHWSEIGFVEDASVQVRRRVGRASTQYNLIRLAAVDRMLEVH